MLHVAFLWHLHQPSYRDPERHVVSMPWVRLHGVKDYTDLALALDAVPGAKSTVNLVPSLTAQLLHASQSLDDELCAQLCLVPAEQLTQAQKAQLTHEFFACALPLRERLPFYAELAQRHARGDQFETRDWRALQIGFQLVWTGLGARALSPELEALYQRAPQFEESDKAIVLRAHQKALAQVLPRWQSLAQKGQVELSCSPFHHPILPLLLDTSLARDADPETPLPSLRLQAPEDVRWHLERAAQHHLAIFGSSPQGLWPSEGSLTEALLPPIAEAGFKWALSDQELLRKSLLQSLGPRAAAQPDAHLSPYERHGVSLLFRDLALSDKIGFTYSKWPKEAAYQDFCKHLLSLAPPPHQDRVVLIALDGENCWEHYPEGVLGFLPGLLRAIMQLPHVRLSTISEALAAVPARPLQRLASGSWIGGTFRTWLGDPVKNRAWDALITARQWLSKTPNATSQAWDLLYRAEASDWWWWFGEGHSSSFDAHFDALFRAHLREIYRLIDTPLPSGLLEPLAQALLRPTPSLRLQVPDFEPTGKKPRYYAYRHAERFLFEGGSMQAGGVQLQELLISSSSQALHLLFRWPIAAREVLSEGSLQLSIQGLKLPLLSTELRHAIDDTLEVRLPVSCVPDLSRPLALSLEQLSHPELHLQSRHPAQGDANYLWVSTSEDALGRGP